MTRWWCLPCVSVVPLVRRRLVALVAAGVVSSAIVAMPAASLLRAQVPDMDTHAHPSDTPASESLRQPVRRTNTMAERLVSLALHNVTLESALLEIGNQAGVVIAYGDRVVPVNRRVTVVAERVPVMKALQLVLRGTDVVATVSPNGKIVLQQQTTSQDSTHGALTGHVTDVTKKRVLSQVRISVEGTKRAVLTDEKGSYVLAGVPPGRYLVTARLLGYVVTERTVTIDAKGAVADFALVEVPARLQEVVTTGAGDRQRLEVGNSIATINADSVVPTTPIRNLSDLLNGRAPGVQVLSSGGTVGAGSRIRIRGVSSVLTTSDPIVIVDGVRVDAAYSTPGLFTGSNSVADNTLVRDVPVTSRLNDIDPESIESIDILKGPSASTLYGSDAANGVIVIKTKNGRPGPTRWSVYGTRGNTHMDAKFLDVGRAWGEDIGSPTTPSCTLVLLATKACTQDSVTYYNPLNYKYTSPFGTGQSNLLGAQVSGGNTQTQYYLGGDYDDEQGMLTLPPFDMSKYLAANHGQQPPDWMVHPNVLNALHLTSKLTTQLGSSANVGVSADVDRQYHRDTPEGPTGIIASSYSSLGYRDSVGLGWGQRSPGLIFHQLVNDKVSRASGGLNGNWHPNAYLSGQATAGADYTSTGQESLSPADSSLGLTATNRARTDMTTLVKTANLGLTLDLPVGTRLHWRSSVGGQYIRNDQDGVQVSGSGLTPGSDVINGATTISAAEANSASATAGWYVEEMLGLNERFFVTGALRGDQGSAFGRSAHPILYPKWSASWLLSQEPFFPSVPALSNLRLRAAFGHAGTQPALDARFRSYQNATGEQNGAGTPTIILSTVGNPDLLPERSVELETGLDLGLWNDRVSVEATLYSKKVHNALVTRTLPPSFGITSRTENIGTVSNHGEELSVTARPIVSNLLNWSVTMGYSKNENKLLSLGAKTLPPSVAVYGAPQYVVGYPLGGFWDYAIEGYDDANNNGIIEANEIRFSDSLVYDGQPIPKETMSWNTNVGLWSGWVNVAATMTYSGAATQLNEALWSLCDAQRCRYVLDPSTSLADQAYVLAAIPASRYSFYGMYEHVSWLRFDELSLTLNVPARLARMAHASTANVSLMGRNLGLWTKYRGADPEVNYLNVGNTSEDPGGVPQTRDWSVRVNLGF